MEEAMRRLLISVAAFALSIGALGQTAQAEEIKLVPSDPGLGLCEPFACATHIQQVFDASLFSSGMIIKMLTFFNLQPNSAEGFVEPAQYRFSLSTTARNSTSLSQDFASNLGNDTVQVLTWDVAGFTTDFESLQLSLSSPFLYNPALGNLLLDIQKDRTGNLGDGPIYADGSIEANGVAMISNYLGEGQNTIRAHTGLTTAFAGSLRPDGVSPVPEPSSMLLLATGVAGLVARARKHRRARH
jgi:hypothetical protein